MGVTNNFWEHIKSTKKRLLYAKTMVSRSTVLFQYEDTLYYKLSIISCCNLLCLSMGVMILERTHLWIWWTIKVTLNYREKPSSYVSTRWIYEWVSFISQVIFSFHLFNRNILDINKSEWRHIFVPRFHGNGVSFFSQ